MTDAAGVSENLYEGPLKLPAERQGKPAHPALDEGRSMMERARRSGIWRTDPPPLEEKLDGVRVLRFAPAEPKRGTVLHFHGGGYRQGCPDMIGPYAAALAARCQVEVVCLEYRLAPEHPFPAGLTDGRKAAIALSAENDGPLLISGDSAGGGMAAALTALEGAVLPVKALVLLSPWLDLTVTSQTFHDNAQLDTLFPFETALEAADLYLQGWSPHDPLASPIFAPAKAFPPTLIITGVEEALIGESRKFQRNLSDAGIDAALHEIPNMQHTAAVRNPALPGAAEAFALIAAFVDQNLAQA